MKFSKPALALISFALVIAVASCVVEIRTGQGYPPPPSTEAPATNAEASPTPVSPQRDEDHSQSGHAEAVVSPKNVSADPAPEYSWVKSETESFVLDPGQSESFAFGEHPGQVANAEALYAPHLVRFDVKASSPVDAGALGQELADNVSYFFGSPFTLCYKPKTLQSQHTCRLTGSQTRGVIVLHDPRPPGAQGAIPALAVAILGSKEPLKQATRENRVTVTFYQWQCTQFCM